MNCGRGGRESAWSIKLVGDELPDKVEFGTKVLTTIANSYVVDVEEYLFNTQHFEWALEDEGFKMQDAGYFNSDILSKYQLEYAKMMAVGIFVKDSSDASLYDSNGIAMNFSNNNNVNNVNNVTRNITSNVAISPPLSDGSDDYHPRSQSDRSPSRSQSDIDTEEESDSDTEEEGEAKADEAEGEEAEKEESAKADEAEGENEIIENDAPYQQRAYIDKFSELPIPNTPQQGIKFAIDFNGELYNCEGTAMFHKKNILEALVVSGQLPKSVTIDSLFDELVQYVSSLDKVNSNSQYGQILGGYQVQILQEHYDGHESLKNRSHVIVYTDEKITNKHLTEKDLKLEAQERFVEYVKNGFLGERCVTEFIEAVYGVKVVYIDLHSPRHEFNWKKSPLRGLQYYLRNPRKLNADDKVIVLCSVDYCTFFPVTDAVPANTSFINPVKQTEQPSEMEYTLVQIVNRKNAPLLPRYKKYENKYARWIGEKLHFVEGNDVIPVDGTIYENLKCPNVCTIVDYFEDRLRKDLMKFKNKTGRLYRVEGGIIVKPDLDSTILLLGTDITSNNILTRDLLLKYKEDIPFIKEKIEYNAFNQYERILNNLKKGEDKEKLYNIIRGYDINTFKFEDGMALKLLENKFKGIVINVGDSIADVIKNNGRFEGMYKNIILPQKRTASPEKLDLKSLQFDADKFVSDADNSKEILDLLKLYPGLKIRGKEVAKLEKLGIVADVDDDLFIIIKRNPKRFAHLLPKAGVNEGQSTYDTLLDMFQKLKEANNKHISLPIGWVLNEKTNERQWRELTGFTEEKREGNFVYLIEKLTGDRYNRSTDNDIYSNKDIVNNIMKHARRLQEMKAQLNGEDAQRISDINNIIELEEKRIEYITYLKEHNADRLEKQDIENKLVEIRTKIQSFVNIDYYIFKLVGDSLVQQENWVRVGDAEPTGGRGIKREIYSNGNKFMIMFQNKAKFIQSFELDQKELEIDGENYELNIWKKLHVLAAGDEVTMVSGICKNVKGDPKNNLIVSVKYTIESSEGGKIKLSGKNLEDINTLSVDLRFVH